MEENILDILLDSTNTDPIDLQDDTGKVVSFEQVAVIPHKGKLYCILKPLDKIDGIADDEAVVFYADESDEDNVTLVAEKNEARAIEVFKEYYKMYEEEQKKSKK